MTLGIVGPGRAGIGLGLAFAGAGYTVRMHGRRGKDVPPPLAFTHGGPPPWVAEVDTILLAVRDDGVEDAAADVGATGGVTDRHTILHLSGLLDRTALAALDGTGAALGSLHPLQAIADPRRAPDRLRGALAAVEGDERAVQTATMLAETIGLVPVPVSAGQKPRYHAGAVVASNYLVVLEAVAERLLADAGLPPGVARAGIAALMRGTLENVAEEGGGALTGPVARGDVETVKRHLAVLDRDAAALYRALGRAALDLADLPGERRSAMERVLG